MDVYKKLAKLKPWQFILLAVISAEILTYVLNSIQSLILWGAVSSNIIEIGFVDAFVVSLILTSIIIPLVRYSEKISFERNVLRKEMTERKQIEEALRESEERYRTLFEGVAEGISVAEVETKEIRYVNTAYCDMYGYTKGEMIGLHVADLHPTESVQSVIATFEAQARGEKIKALNLPCMRKDGSVFFADVSARPIIIAGRPMVVGFFSDVTERMVADRKLRQSEERFRVLLDKVSNIAVQAYGPDGTVRLWNKASEEIYGYTQAEALGRNLVDLIIPPEMRDAVRGDVRRMIETGAGLPSEELLLMRKDGSRVPVYSNHTVIDISGAEKELYSIDVDLTGLKQAEASALRSEERSSLILNSAAEGIYGIDIDGNCTFCNASSIKMLGYSNELDLIGTDMHNLIHHTKADGTPYPKDQCLAIRVFSTGGHAHSDKEIMWRADGSSFPAEYWAYPIQLETRVTGAVVTFIDITERRKIESELRQAQKLEGIGQLAGGIAHDFNNVLNAVVGFAGLLQMQMDKADPLVHYADEIMAAGQRGAALTQQILAFGRKQVLNMKPVDLNETVKSIVKMLHRLVREDIDIQFNLANEDLVIFADVSQIDQLLINLVTNARDAMPNGGKLGIATGAFVMDRKYIEMHGYGSPGEYAVMTISDAGCGMDAKTRAHIFEPFYTTKESAKGTGLGLAVVHGIVKQHNGYIDVHSETGKGTNFKIYLPLTEHTIEETEIKTAVQVKGGTETILIAEDDAPLRKLSQTVLSHYGYKVIEAVDGEDAVRKFTEHRDDIELVILDGIMPNKNGKEAFDDIRKLCPEMKAIFMSGYAEDIFIHEGIPEKTAFFVQKPVTPNNLLRKVRATLDV